MKRPLKDPMRRLQVPLAACFLLAHTSTGWSQLARVDAGARAEIKAGHASAGSVARVGQARDRSTDPAASRPAASSAARSRARAQTRARVRARVRSEARARAASALSPASARAAARAMIQRRTASEGAFEVQDSFTGETLELSLRKLERGVRQIDGEAGVRFLQRHDLELDDRLRSARQAGELPSITAVRGRFETESGSDVTVDLWLTAEGNATFRPVQELIVEQDGRARVSSYASLAGQVLGG